MTLEELGEKLADLDASREVAESELGLLSARRERVEELEAERDALLEYAREAIPEGLEGLDGDERRTVYRMLRLEVTPTSEGLRTEGVFCASETTYAPPRPSGRQRPYNDRTKGRGSPPPGVWQSGRMRWS